MPSSGLSSAFMSPNHPINLRKQAQPKLDSSFSVKTYIGAANALLEKAKAADAQGQLEVAFVNYLKAAGVASFISKHDEWPKIQKSRGSVYQSYNELMKQVPSFIDRTKRIEDQLRVREERNAQLQKDALAAQQQQQQQGQQQQRSSQHSTHQPMQEPELPPPIVDPTPPGSDEGHGHVRHGTDASPIDDYQPGLRMSNSLADRLQALRNSAASDPAELRSRSRSGSASASSSPAPGLPRTGDLASHLEALAEDTDSGHYSGPRPPSRSQHGQAEGSGQVRFPQIPSASEFASSYPTLDDFEKGSSQPTDGSTEGNGQGIFPAPPSHPVGKAKRPLPEPPSSTSIDVAREFALVRDVPEPFEPSSSSGGRTNIEGLPSSSRTNPHRMSLQHPPSRYRPALGGPSSPSSQGVPQSLLVGNKPTPPLSNHITVQELFFFLNPGFEEFTDTDGSRKIGKKVGLDVLLLDVRSRADYEAGRILGARSVCIEPITLREGMSSTDIEDKLLLSPPEEQLAFASRNEFDLVVLHDRNLRALRTSSHEKAPQDPAAQARMDILIKAIYENEFIKTLKHQPVLLVGGFDSWYKSLGEKMVLRECDPSANGSSSSGSGAAANRTSISFEAGTRFPSADDPNTRAATAEQIAQQQELKRTRRQQQILPDSLTAGHPASAGRSSTSSAGGMHPGSVYPSRANGVSGASSFGSLSGYSSGTVGVNGFPSDGPSMPARAYQSHTVASSGYVTSGAPSFPPVAAHRPPSRSNSSSTFDYPQLKHAGTSSSVTASSPYGMPTPQPPPMAASSSSPVPTGHSARSQSISTPTSLVPGAGSAGGADPSKKQVMAPGYAGHVSTQSRMYSSPTNGRRADEIRIGMTGLKNVGNSCYMNATLQCLSATIPLARFLLDGSYRKAINKTNPLGTQGALAEAFAQLVRVMWSEQYTFVSPVTFREAMGKVAPSFRGCDQHDSQEFLAILLDGLHEDLNYIVTRPPAIEMTPEREKELEMLPQQIASVKEWGIYRMRNDSLIVDWFQGQFRNKLTCLTCGKTSTTYEAFTYLSLPIPHGRGVNKATLQQCLDAFVREEVLDKADMWNCPACKKPRKATKRLSISRLPQVLLIHLKRFSFKGPFTDKVDTTVSFPTSNLDLTNYMPPPLPPMPSHSNAYPTSSSQKPPYLYDLYAVTHHFGSLNTGHYTASIRNNDSWWYCDDSRCYKSDDRQIHTNSPYVLWFRRRPN
ncbi:hypothetical protein BCV70DRAFT_155655 [Testicularia cyperi]|uniref:ubiquitinyl hydrolase 1 n=1 Tax=Testicularia cyperi TaxID=1882483 RepID=A0A317XZM2_9BASI|nr:hypothetical protein BCV70DRAFT_155655 [Testicularia cyperi]